MLMASSNLQSQECSRLCVCVFECTLRTSLEHAVADCFVSLCAALPCSIFLDVHGTVSSSSDECSAGGTPCKRDTFARPKGGTMYSDAQ
eukprot:2143861-Amphidinium_carterae.1